jgi:putative pyruvate formate lyase activating enzyme
MERGAENINIVTGSHSIPALAEGLAGLRHQILWNSSGYELPNALDLLADTVDVFLPDIKTLDTTVSARFFNAPDYPAVAQAAIKKMIQMRPLQFEEKEDGPARLVSGVMVRHLVLPGYLESSRKVLRWFSDSCMSGEKALLSLMFQYTFVPSINNKEHGPMRYISPAEYDKILEWLSEFGIEDGYCQELIPGNDWLPDFERPNPFPPDMAIPVWHWKTGFSPMPLLCQNDPIA